jgi:hypothetical protein
MDAIAHLIAMAIFDFGGAKAKIANAKLEKIDFSGDILHALLTAACVKDPNFTVKDLSYNCLDTIRTRLRDLGNLDGKYSFVKHFQLMTSEMLATNGATYPYSPGYYVEKWQALKVKVPGLCQHYKDLSNTYNEDGDRLFSLSDLDPTFKDSLTNVDKLLTSFK